MHHPRYYPAHHPGISSNITNSTHFSAPTTLAHYPPYPRWHTTHANKLPTPHTLPTQPHHPCQHVTHAGTISRPYLKFFCHQIVTEHFLKENLSSKNLPIENLLPDNKVHEEIYQYETYSRKFAPTLTELFYLYPIHPSQMCIF